MQVSARIGVTASLLVLALPAPALAASSASNPGSGSAIDVYTQSQPTASGKVVPGITKNKATPLSGKALRSLKSVDKRSRNLLTKITTQTSVGAPGAKLAVTSDAANLNSSTGRSLLASIISPGSGSGVRLLVLLIAMVSIVAAFGVTAVRKQRAAHLPRD